MKNKEITTENSSPEEMRHAILQALFFRGLKQRLSERKLPDGSPAYKEALAKIQKYEDEVYGKGTEADG